MWAEHCISSPSSPWWSWWFYIFNPREAYNGNLCWDWTCHGVCICYCPRSLSWLDGLLPFPVFLIIVGWLVRGCCRKNLQRFFFSKIHFYVIPVFYYIVVLVLLIYIYVLISFFNEEYRRQQWFLFWIFETFCLYCWVMLMLMLAREKYFGNQVSHLPASCRPRWLIVHPRTFSTKVFVSSAPFGTLLLITKNFRQL